MNIDDLILSLPDLFEKQLGTKFDSGLVFMIMFKIYVKKLRENYKNPLEQPITCIFKKKRFCELIF